ncbi:MAG: hypothetical protein ACTSPN_06810 [Promethearchaeota archaeon]
MADIKTQLKEHLDKGNDWEKMETPVARPALLFLEINPLKDDGKPMKRKGLFVANKEMFVKFMDALNDDNTFKLIQELEQVNPKITTKTKKLEM